MPDFNPTLDPLLEQWRRDAEFASQIDSAWRIMLTVGAALLVVLAIAAIIFGAFRLSQGRRKPPLPPKSIVATKSVRRRQYTGKEGR